MKIIKNLKLAKRFRIKKRIRSQVQGTAERPRLTVFRSNKAMYAQLIDDVSRTTIASASDIKMKDGTKAEKAAKIGEAVAKMALDKKINTVVFDRNGYKYVGRIKILADSARSAGLTF
jgi:large subunit ribosomal protein L18